MPTVKGYLDAHQDKLQFFTQAIIGAHGEHHPEVVQVRAAYLQLQAKADQGATDFRADFDHLRQITNNYAIPGDVCEVFAATYHMLQQADALSVA